jgi:hypothetical protein
MRALYRAAVAAGLVTAFSHAAVAQGRDADLPSPPRDRPSAERLIYADFEAVDNGRALSSRGGAITATRYQESDLHQTKIKGAPNAPDSPELVRIKPDDPNHLGKIEFAFAAPNQWAGASIEIKGQADANGKPQADDVTGYKKITLQLYATGVTTIRVQAISKGQGTDLQQGYPEKVFKVRPGLNTYEVPLKTLLQPGWVEIKVDPKKILQNLTQLNISAFCEQCTPTDGMLIVDNVTFEK